MSEVWLSGPIDGVPPLLMPPAHTLVQVRHDVTSLLGELPSEQLWRPVGASAPIGFHALHIAGSIERLMTYARGEQLTDAQMHALGGEPTMTGLAAHDLTARVDGAIDVALQQIRATPADALLIERFVGRKMLPSTTLGLIVHAAEHALRHAGQMATLKKVLDAQT
ncbi:MAG TPA: DinB family protein [Vicinamibacterales bacterium]|nr:DinB family protein [Vicinamibacterales bacterium]